VVTGCVWFWPGEMGGREGGCWEGGGQLMAGEMMEMRERSERDEREEGGMER
jgi:hypothetical protein